MFSTKQFDNAGKLTTISGIKNVVPENVKINGKPVNEAAKEQNPLGSSDKQLKMSGMAFWPAKYKGDM
jgi:hypothetical protein